MLIDFGYLAYNNFCKNKNTSTYILSKELREPKSLKLSKNIMPFRRYKYKNWLVFTFEISLQQT